jgi:hypothetical protein
MNNEHNIPRLQGESDYHYSQRCKAITYLGKRWILAEKVARPANPEWRC